ncbi:MAG: TIGR03808 family TAT-translocated repetitive protein, partial [Pseudomonadota bacterium]
MHRRSFLTLSGTMAASVLLARPVLAQSGATSAREYGVAPNTRENQSARFQSMLDQAAIRGEPIFLPAGTYVVSNIALPDGLVLTGVPGRTVLAHAGGEHLLIGRDAQRLHLSNLTLDGANAPGAEAGLLRLIAVTDAQVMGCTVRRARQDAISLERTGGRFSDNTTAEAARFGLFSRDSRGLDITGNRVADCADGGIIVHRSTQSRENTRITGNRIARVGAASGGTGQWGNGINVFRTDHVVIADNLIEDCAFSAIRSNSGRHLHIRGNQCLASGETAIYSEFSFENAVISDNLILGGT